MLRVLALQASHTVEHGRGMNRVYLRFAAPAGWQALYMMRIGQN